MNKPTPLGKQTFAEYEKEVKDFKAFNLKAEKVELGMMDDFEKAFTVAQNDGSAEKLITNLRKAEVGFEKAIKLHMKAEDIGEALKKAAKELGVDLPKIVINKIASSREGVKEHRMFINKIQSMYNMF